MVKTIKQEQKEHDKYKNEIEQIKKEQNDRQNIIKQSEKDMLKRRNTVIKMRMKQYEKSGAILNGYAIQKLINPELTFKHAIKLVELNEIKEWMETNSNNYACCNPHYFDSSSDDEEFSDEEDPQNLYLLDEYS